MSGDYVCSLCGVEWCSGGDRCIRYGMELKVTKLKTDMTQFAVGSRELGAAMKRPELEKMLAGYMGDDFFAKQFMDCIDLIKAKNADYTEGQGDRDRIKHFRDASAKHDIPIQKIWGIFVDKHWSAVQKFLKSGQTESEPIDGRINDVINYMVLLAAIIEDMRGDSH